MYGIILVLLSIILLFILLLTRLLDTEAELAWVIWGHVTPQIKKKLKIFSYKKNKKKLTVQARRAVSQTATVSEF